MGKKITDLSAATTPLAGTELIEIVQGGSSKKVSASALTASSASREMLTADRTYYVRTDGSDSNDGLSNTSGGAFLTIQNAINVICSTLDVAGYTITIQVADGTYTTPIIAKVFAGGGSIIINGNSGTPTNVVVNTTSANCFTNTSGSIGYSIRYMKLTTTTSGNCIYCGLGSRAFFQNIDFGAAPGSAHLYVEQGGKIQAQATYTISGAATYHYVALSQGEVRVTGSWTVTITGSPAFTSFAYSASVGFIHHSSVTFSGTVTGKRYDASENAVIKTYGGGANYFPGNTAGTTATGGQYV